MKKRFKILLAGSLICLLIAYFIYPLIGYYKGNKYLASFFTEQPSRFSPQLIEQITALPNFEALPKTDKPYRVVLTSRANIFAEFAVLYRIAETMNKLGWEWAIIDDADRHHSAIKILNPDFIIAIRSEMKAVPGFTNLLYIHSFISQYLYENGEVRRKYRRNLVKYDGFLQLLPHFEPVEEYFASQNIPFNYINTYFTVSKTPFAATPKTKLCFWGGALWDHARSSQRYLDLYQALDNTGYFVIYGPEIAWQDKNYKSYRGKVSIENDALIESIKEAGIALVLHSSNHLEAGVPTARIFEAVAAGAVVISDQHPFVKEHFGDTVFYVDQTLSGEEMFKQIDQYVKWVHNHPQEAIAKAKAAHQIFIEKFTLEGELKKIAAFYEQVKKKEK